MTFDLQGFENVFPTLKRVSSKVKKLKDEREDELKKNHDRFNLFTILLRSDDEVRLHTRYLTHLLDPNGLHDFKRLFLDLFLDEVGLSDLKEQECEYVAKEHYTNGLGNIDIYLEFKNAVLVIENKIWADDQNGQLWRYAEYAKNKGKVVHLLYLTPEGKQASKKSLANPDDANDSLDEDDVSLISYRETILAWLELCLEKIDDISNIKQSLMQYKKTIRENVLNMKMNQDDINAAVAMIEDDEESVVAENTFALMDVLKSFRNKRVDDFFDKLSSELKSVENSPFDNIEKIWKGWGCGDGERSNRDLAMSLNNRVFIAIRREGGRRAFYIGITDDFYNKSGGEEFAEKIARDNPEITKCDWPKLKRKLFDLDEDLSALKKANISDLVEESVDFDKKIREKVEDLAVGL